MAEIRLNKLIKQFNIGLDTLVDFLNSKGAGIEHANPNMKISDEYLPELHARFGKDLSLKKAAERVDVKLTEILDRASRKSSDTPSTKEEPENEEQQNEMREPLPASVAPEDFDWDAFEAEAVPGDSREEVAAMFEQSLQKVVENEVVEGVVTGINRREVVINIGAKVQGVIRASEFRYNPDLKVGDKVEVFVESAEDRRGQLVISHKKARQLKSWNLVKAAYENDEIVKAYVKTRTKGGMLVDVFGIEAFLPGSQIDTKKVRDFDVFVDTVMDVKIIQINEEFRNVVVSHRVVLEAKQGNKENPKSTTRDSGQKAQRETVAASKDSSTMSLDPEAFFSEKALELLKKGKSKE